MPRSVHDYSELVGALRKAAQKHRHEQGVPVRVEAGIIDEFMEQLEISPVAERTYVVALAVHTDPDKNSSVRLSCSGTPVDACSYDCVNDYFGVNCLDHINLGHIPIAFRLSVCGVSRWGPFVPIPENIILRYLSPKQILDLDKFKSAYDGDEVRIEFLQTIE